MTALQKAIVGMTLAAAIGMGVHQAHQNSKLRQENQTLRQQAMETEALRSENERLAKLLANAGQASQGREEHLELLRLRGEVARLRQQTTELETLRKERAQLRTSLASGQNQKADGTLESVWLADSNRVSAAKAIVFNAAAGIADKVVALRILRSINARSDEVVQQMIQAYNSTNDAKLRADIFRQLSGVTTPELKPLLVEAVRDTNQDTETRQEAAETLAHYLPDPDAKAWLEHLAANDLDERVRAEATRRLQAYQHRHAR